jgi:hypothetical protein
MTEILHCSCKMDVRFVLSGIFLSDEGKQLLEFIDNTLVQKKKKEQSYSVRVLFEEYLRDLAIQKSACSERITTDDIIKHMNESYKCLKKEDRYIIYMDGVRTFFYNLAHNIETEIYKPRPSVCKPVSDARQPSLRDMRSKHKTSYTPTIISETTDVQSAFTRCIS